MEEGSGDDDRINEGRVSDMRERDDLIDGWI